MNFGVEVSVGPGFVGPTMTTEATTPTFMGKPVTDPLGIVGYDQPVPSDRFPEGHPVADAVTSMHATLDRLVEAPMWSLQPGELRTLLVASTRLKARVEELELRVARAAERADVGAVNASTSTGVWWAEHTGQVKSVAIGRLTLAKALDYDHEPVRDALAAGDLVVEQAQVIVRAVEQLTKGPAKDLVPPEVVAEAQATLIELVS